MKEINKQEKREFKGTHYNVSPLCQGCFRMGFALHHGIWDHECEKCENAYELEKQEMETVKIEFSGEDLNMILKYQEVSEATTIQNTIMNAISLALDHVDDGK